MIYEERIPHPRDPASPAVKVPALAGMNCGEAHRVASIASVYSASDASSARKWFIALTPPPRT